MNKQTILLTLLIVVTLGLGIAALYEQQHYAVHTNQAIIKANAQRDAAITETKQHDTAAKLQLDSTTAQILTLTNQKNALCNQIKTAKLSNSLCP